MFCRQTQESRKTDTGKQKDRHRKTERSTQENRKIDTGKQKDRHRKTER